jgi:predicted 3-demethylubiquinone-9 3-methyltransferase (glyoxalase superfamily)
MRLVCHLKNATLTPIRRENMSKVTPFLMFNDQLEAAIAFYTSTFPDSEIKNVARNGADGPITSAEFVVGGQSFMGYNGGSYFTFSQGVSLFVNCESQAEVDEYWNKFVNAGAGQSHEGSNRQS